MRLILLALLFPSFLFASDLTKQNALRADSGLVGWWKLDDTAARDFSGYGNHGTATGGTVAVVGKVGGSLRMNGSSTSVRVPFASSLSFGTGPFTLSAWVKPVDLLGHANFQEIMAKDVSGSRDWTFFYTTTLTFSGITPAVNVASGSVMTTNQWQMLTASRSGSTVTLYRNAVALTSGTVTNNFNFSNDIYIGAREFVGFREFLNGDVDDVRIYRRALSATEVAQLYADTNLSAYRRREWWTEMFALLAWRIRV